MNTTSLVRFLFFYIILISGDFASFYFNKFVQLVPPFLHLAWTSKRCFYFWLIFHDIICSQNQSNFLFHLTSFLYNFTVKKKTVYWHPKH